jgi:hypothetical protein
MAPGPGVRAPLGALRAETSLNRKRPSEDGTGLLSAALISVAETFSDVVRTVLIHRALRSGS